MEQKTAKVKRICLISSLFLLLMGAVCYLTTSFAEADTRDPDDLRAAMEEGQARYDREMAAAEKEERAIEEEEKALEADEEALEQNWEAYEAESDTFNHVRTSIDTIAKDFSTYSNTVQRYYDLKALADAGNIDELSQAMLASLDSFLGYFNRIVGESLNLANLDADSSEDLIDAINKASEQAGKQVAIYFSEIRDTAVTLKSEDLADWNAELEEERARLADKRSELAERRGLLNETRQNLDELSSQFEEWKRLLAESADKPPAAQGTSDDPSAAGNEGTSGYGGRAATGDDSNIVLYGIIALMAAAAAAGAAVYRKKEN